MDKQESMSELRAEAQAVLERLCDPGRSLVWGEGNLDSPLAIYGEAPGRQEDSLGRPFVGKAGRFLDVELALAGIPRESVYISNVVKCRPTRIEADRPVNRPPNVKEIAAWSDLLAREIEIVSPKMILCLGAVAASAMIHPTFRINAERGTLFDSAFGPRAMATFHPSYVLRADSQVIRVFREDLRVVADVIAALRDK